MTRDEVMEAWCWLAFAHAVVFWALWVHSDAELRQCVANQVHVVAEGRP